MYSHFMHTLFNNNRLFLTTAKLVRGLSDIATTNVCKVDTSNRNLIERSRWMKWLITGLRQKKYPLIWMHYESGLFYATETHCHHSTGWIGCSCIHLKMATLLSAAGELGMVTSSLLAILGSFVVFGIFRRVFGTDRGKLPPGPPNIPFPLNLVTAFLFPENRMQQLTSIHKK